MGLLTRTKNAIESFFKDDEVNSAPPQSAVREMADKSKKNSSIQKMKSRSLIKDLEKLEKSLTAKGLDG